MKPKLETQNNPPILSSDEINKIDEFRRAKQTAVLTILFSDIENSTHATEILGERTYSRLRHIHDELFIRIMTIDNSGKIIKEIGDSFLCVFSEPSTAVLRALEFQQAIHSNRDNLTMDGFTLRVKIGIHVGQVSVENNYAPDIFGSHVNRASRIQSIANGGQILTSQAIWENAVGWLKNHKEKNIDWISYGKTKLKGIKGSVDIYCFYTGESGKPSLPGIFKKKRNRNLTVLCLGVILAFFVFYFLFEKFNQIKQDSLVNSQLLNKKSYYIQFDFSDLKYQTIEGKLKQMPDTISIQENLLSQLIAVFNPDSVITESDLIKLFSRNGAFYVRHFNQTSSDSRYFRDSLKFSGSIFITAESISSNNDSIKMHIRMDMYPGDNSSTASDRNEWLSIANIEGSFRNLIQDMIMSTSDQMWVIQGYVTNSNDSIVYFKMTNDASLRVGASIRLMREYIEIDGLRQRLADLTVLINYFKNNSKDSSLVKSYLKEYSEIEDDISKSISRGSWSTGVDLKGNIIELYDTTGKASWTLIGEFLLDKPRQGDVIYLGY